MFGALVSAFEFTTDHSYEISSLVELSSKHLN